MYRVSATLLGMWVLWTHRDPPVCMEFTELWARQTSSKRLTSFLISGCDCEECCEEGTRKDTVDKKMMTTFRKQNKKNTHREGL